MAKTVELSKSYKGAGGSFASLTFREPKWADFIELGEIEEWQPLGVNEDGTSKAVLIRHQDVLAQYAERLVEAPRAAGDLQMLELADTLEVTSAIRDFFSTARASRQPRTGSSGDTAKASPTSAD